MSSPQPSVWGVIAAETGSYVECNWANIPAGKTVYLYQGQALPQLAPGCTWRLVAPQSKLENSPLARGLLR